MTIHLSRRFAVVCAALILLECMTAESRAQTPKHVDLPDIALNQSELVTSSPDGTPVVSQKDGKPFDGVKLSTYDSSIYSPQIACASNGTIHVAYVEQQASSPFARFVFHRQSSDGGKTWSETKNLSESMAGINVGTCQLCIDGNDRVYVVWRSSLKVNFPVLQTAAGNGQHNLVYRVLDKGKWSKIIPVHPPGSPETQDNGSVSFSASTDAAGHVQVVFNTIPDRFHPEKYCVVSGQYFQHCPGVRAGLVFQSTLDGSNPPTPKELFCANFHEVESEGKYGKHCDGLDGINFFADEKGNPHFIARVYGDDQSDRNIQISLFEGGKGEHIVKLPASFTFDANPPKLLVDAAGKKHVIALYEAGEHPTIKDYLVGSDDDPTTILAAKAPKGTCYGFKAFQGPNGKMIALMATTDEGQNDRGDSWVSTSNGGEWSKPVCITNNAGREKWWAKDTGVLSGVAGGKRMGPGDGAAAIAADGHMVVVLINNETGSFGLSAGGVVYSSGSSTTPRLCFYRF